MLNRNYRETHAFQMDKNDLGMLLYQLRVSKGLTVRELGDNSGVSFYMISNIESGKSSPSFFTISRIFNSMGLSVSEAYSMIENPDRVS